MQPVNILADFCNRDIRLLAGCWDRFPAAAHRYVLGAWLNISVLLSRDFCVIPFSFATECDVLRAVLHRKRDLINSGRVIFSNRDSSIPSTVTRRRTQYEYASALFPALFQPEAVPQLERLRPQFLRRSRHTSDGIIRQWETRPDDAPIWISLLENLDHRTVDRIRLEPRKLIGENRAILWPHFAKTFNLPPEEAALFRRLLNEDMLETYIQEHQLFLLRNLPFGWKDFKPAIGPAYLNVSLLQAFAGEVLLNVFMQFRPPDLLRLRESPAYFALIDAYISATADAQDDPWSVAKLGAARRARCSNDLTILETCFGPRVTLSSPQAFFTPRLRRCLLSVCEALATDVPIKRSSLKRKSRMSNRLAIFVALDLEANILVKIFGLTKVSATVWSRKSSDFELYVYQANGMGRVNAAVATACFLEDHAVDLIIVAGIAGGFERNKVTPGHIIVADNVVDLSIRKRYEDEGTEFRPVVHNLNTSLHSVLKGPNFDFDRWAFEVCKDVDWPDDRRPALKPGQITSLDEVVADRKYAATLLNLWPGLLGVEMEAGGVCAMARARNVQVSVIRGVSDKADPSKKDDEWRSRIMKTIGHLLNKVDLKEVLEHVR